MSEKRFPGSLKKQREAKQRGDIPRAPLLTKGGALLGGLLGLWWQAPVLRQLFMQTLWFDWYLLWWHHLKQLGICLALICGSAASGAYLLGSLAGGFLFSAGALRGSPGLSRLSPSANFFVSLALSLGFAGVGVYAGGRWLSGLSWALAAKDARLFDDFVATLFWCGFIFAGFAAILGVLQAIFSWYFWHQRHQRTFQEFAQDSKDEEGKAKQFFSSQIAEQKQRPG